MKLNIKWLVAASLLALLGGPAAPARADFIIWYNGDHDPTNPNANGLANERDAIVDNANTYDNFILSTTATISSVFSNNLMNITATTAYWEIRSGVSAGNGGTLVAGGVVSPATQTPTGRSDFGFTEFTVAVSGLSVTLGPGEYWLNVTPVSSDAGRSFNSNTFGLNAIGTPPGNDLNDYFNSSFFGANFDTASDQGVQGDFSMGIIGTTGPLSAPEPASMILMGLGAAGLFGYGWRRRKGLAAA